MKSPMFAMTPDYSPVIRMMEMQTRFAMETSQAMMKLAMLPWQGMTPPKMAMGFTNICAPSGVSVAPAAEKSVAPVALVAEPVFEAEPDAVAAAPDVVEAVAEVVELPAPEAEAAPSVDAIVEEPAPVAEAAVDESGPVAPRALKAPTGDADDLTALNGVGPKLAETLNEAGIYHFSQIAKWSDANVAWVDTNVAGVRGRASRNGWVAQAADLTQ